MDEKATLVYPEKGDFAMSTSVLGFWPVAKKMTYINIRIL